MSEANPIGPGSGAPPAAVPDPKRPGEGGVRWKEVVGGFAIALGVMWGIRIVLWVVIAYLPLAGEYAGLIPSLVAWYVPIPVVLWLIWRNAKRGNKGRAIGMAIYAGLAAMLVTACWTMVGVS